MNKAQLIEAIAMKEEMAVSQVETIVNDVLSLISTALSVGEEVKLTNFGKFSTHDRKPGVRRNPRTGGTVDVPARTVVGFRPAQALKARVDVSYQKMATSQKATTFETHEYIEAESLDSSI